MRSRDSNCGSEGGRCAPDEPKVAVFALAGVSPEIAIAAPGVDPQTELFLAPGTFPALPDHPFHAALFERPTIPNTVKAATGPFTFRGEVTDATFDLGVRVAESERALESEPSVQLDAQTRVVGFDRDGIPTILLPGAEIVVTGRMCVGELPGPLADVIEPAP